jgi:hypothetical protein
LSDKGLKSRNVQTKPGSDNVMQFNLEKAVGQVRGYTFSAFWQGETTTRTAFREEDQRSQGAEKVCHRICSAVTHSVNVLVSE